MCKRLRWLFYFRKIPNKNANESSTLTFSAQKTENIVRPDTRLCSKGYTKSKMKEARVRTALEMATATMAFINIQYICVSRKWIEICVARSQICMCSVCVCAFVLFRFRWMNNNSSSKLFRKYKSKTQLKCKSVCCVVCVYACLQKQIYILFIVTWCSERVRTTRRTYFFSSLPSVKNISFFTVKRTFLCCAGFLWCAHTLCVACSVCEIHSVLCVCIYLCLV